MYAVGASCVAFGVWAAMAPRGAAVGLVVILMLDIVADLVVATHHNRAAAITIPFNVLAVVFAIRSLPTASSYLEAKRRDDEREREYDRQERWRNP